MAILEEDIERSLYEYLEPRLEPIAVDLAGEWFDPSKLPKQWLEPRITRIVHPGTSKVGQESFPTRLVVTGYIKVGKKGGRKFELSRLIDVVLAAIDVNVSAIAAPIKDRDGTEVGKLQFQTVVVERLLGVDVVIRKVEVRDVDVAVITTDAISGGC